MSGSLFYQIIGFAAAVYGIGLIYIPAAFILGGVTVIVAMEVRSR